MEKIPLNTLVITEQGSRLTRKGGQLILLKAGIKILVRPLIQINFIVLMGRVEISMALISFALGNDIRISLLTVDGRYKGHISSPKAKNILIRVKQFETMQKSSFRMDFARIVVAGKIHNYCRMLQKKAPVVYQAFRQRLKNVRKSIVVATSRETLRGLEGSFSALYFRNLPSLLIEDFGFKKRIKHPPPDPLNVLLSLAYTALFNNIYAFVEAAGLDPYCGLLHEISYGHPALVSDLMEEFRAPVADSFVIQLVNKKIITPNYFFKDDNKLRIDKQGLALFFNEYRIHIETKFLHKEMQLNYLQIIERQVQYFVRLLKGEESNYVCYKLR